MRRYSRKVLKEEEIFEEEEVFEEELSFEKEEGNKSGDESDTRIGGWSPVQSISIYRNEVCIR